MVQATTSKYEMDPELSMLSLPYQLYTEGQVVIAWSRDTYGMHEVKRDQAITSQPIYAYIAHHVKM